jgi:hypothetical protein
LVLEQKLIFRCQLTSWFDADMSEILSSSSEKGNKPYSDPTKSISAKATNIEHWMQIIIV